MKKFLAIAALSSAAVMAAEAGKSGFYLGASAGYSTTKISHKFENTEDAALANFKPKGFIGGLFAGYNFAINNKMSVGIEAGFDFSGVKGTSEAINLDSDVVDGLTGEVSFKTETKRKESFKLAVKPTYNFGKVAAYLNMGWVNTKFEVNAIAQDAATINGNAIAENAKVKLASKRVNGFEIGAGFKVPFGKISAGAEYNYGIYNKTEGNLKPRTHDFRVRVAYSF